MVSLITSKHIFFTYPFRLHRYVEKLVRSHLGWTLNTLASKVTTHTGARHCTYTHTTKKEKTSTWKQVGPWEKEHTCNQASQEIHYYVPTITVFWFLIICLPWLIFKNIYPKKRKLTFYVSFLVQKLMLYVSFWAKKLFHNVSFWIQKFFVQKLIFFVSFWIQKLTIGISFWVQKLIQKNSFWFPILGLLAKLSPRLYQLFIYMSTAHLHQTPTNPHPTPTVPPIKPTPSPNPTPELQKSGI